MLCFIGSHRNGGCDEEPPKADAAGGGRVHSTTQGICRRSPQVLVKCANHFEISCCLLPQSLATILHRSPEDTIDLDEKCWRKLRTNPFGKWDIRNCNISTGFYTKNHLSVEKEWKMDSVRHSSDCFTQLHTPIMFQRLMSTNFTLI